MIEVGAEVTGVWGAMEPEWRGVITEILDECVIIRWDNGADHYATVGTIRTDYYEEGGAKIGVHVGV